MLFALLVALQITDVITTNRGLAIPGHWEANPIMGWSQAQLGSVWWLPKIVVVGLAAFAAPLSARRWPMICAVSYYGAIVLCNFAQL